MATRSLILLGLLSPLLLAAGPAREPLSNESMAALMTREVSLFRRGRTAEAERTLPRRMAAEREGVKRADLLEAFGVQLFKTAPKLDATTSAKVLDYLGRAVDAYRLTLGKDDPEVAMALVRRAEVERLIHPEEPASWVDPAYQQAYQIRFAKLGHTAIETLSTMIPMAQMQALPSRAKGDPAAVESALSLLRQVQEEAARSTDPRAAQLRDDAVAAMQALDGVYGSATPTNGAASPQVRGALASALCPTSGDAIIFSGQDNGLKMVRDSFRKANLRLVECRGMLIFQLGKGIDPSPVINLISEISAGRVPGVRLGLSEKDSSSEPWRRDEKDKIGR